MSHYEGQRWTDFYHYAALRITAYAFLMCRRLRHNGVKENGARPETLAPPEDYVPCGGTARTESHTGFPPNPAPTHRARHRSDTITMPLLRTGKGQRKFLTQHSKLGSIPEWAQITQLDCCGRAGRLLNLGGYAIEVFLFYRQPADWVYGFSGNCIRFFLCD